MREAIWEIEGADLEVSGVGWGVVKPEVLIPWRASARGGSGGVTMMRKLSAV